MYENSFTELCGWLEHLLRDGFLVSLMVVRNKYQEIIELRKETITGGTTRTACLHERLHRKFENQILFTKVSNRQDVFLAWNDLSKITQSTLINSLISEHECNVGPKKIFKDRGNGGNQDIQEEQLLMEVKLQLRQIETLVLILHRMTRIMSY